MRVGFSWLWGLALGLPWLGIPPAWAHGVPASPPAPWAAAALLAELPGPPPPPLPPLAPEPSPCVRRYGNTGCAARLYAELLCRQVGVPVDPAAFEEQLQRAFEEAAINFNGIGADQIETAAVRYYSPMLCPQKSPQIRELFDALLQPAAGAGAAATAGSRRLLSQERATSSAEHQRQA